jgi:hypothetical protein
MTWRRCWAPAREPGPGTARTAATTGRPVGAPDAPGRLTRTRQGRISTFTAPSCLRWNIS